jgi:hypothetical protein
MGHAIDKTATAPAPTSERRHVRLRPGLVDEDETRRINRRLTLLPALAMPRDVGPFLLGLPPVSTALPGGRLWPILASVFDVLVRRGCAHDGASGHK